MPTVILEAINGGDLFKDDLVYGTAHNAAVAEITSNNGLVETGQYFESAGSIYGVYRGHIAFDTSSISNQGSITSGTLSMYGLSDSSTTDFDMILVEGSAISIPAVDADYGDLLGSTTSGGSINSLNWSLSSYNDIVLNSAALSWIVKAGTTSFGFRSLKDVNSNVPTTYEWVEGYAVDATYPAKLTLTYNTGFIPKVLIM